MQVQSNVIPHLINNALNCVTMHFGCKYTCLYVEKKVSPFSSYPTAITRDTKLAPLRSITEIYGNQPLPTDPWRRRYAPHELSGGLLLSASGLLFLVLETAVSFIAILFFVTTLRR